MASCESTESCGSTEISPGSDASVRCADCADVIGVYEPAVWLLADRTGITGSLLAPPALSEGQRVIALLHASCAERH